MVIMSRGISSKPISPRMMPAARTLGRMPMTARETDRNSTSSIRAMPSMTTPRVSIWEVNRLCSMLLYNTIMPLTWNSSSSRPSFARRSASISSRNCLRRRSGRESRMRILMRASLSSMEMYGSINCSFIS